MKERFGERIRRLRTEQKLGLREFATKVGISPTYLSRIETSEEKAPPAEEVIGGLVSATFLTLFVLPTVYAFVYRKEQRPPPDGAEGSAPLEESSAGALAEGAA